MKLHGFTVVELIITMAIMVILLTLAVVSLRSGQVAARDDERASKAQTIANGLEGIYNHGFTPVGTGQSSHALSPGQYPSIAGLTNAAGYLESYLPGVEASTLKYTWQSPSTYNLHPYQHPTNQYLNGDTLDITAQAFNHTGTHEIILYEPLRQRTASYPSDTDQWEICTTIVADHPCTRFNLYYIKESDDSLITITSKHG